ncbi:MAG: hypothetical protein ACOYWZ_04280 [Bacillota bacterium]
MMKCSFCGFEFNIENSRNGCAGCPMNKSCGKVKCPNCNYEMYPEPEFKLFNTIKNGVKRIWNR